MKSKLLVLLTLILIATASTWAQTEGIISMITAKESGSVTIRAEGWNTIMINDTPLEMNGFVTQASVPVPSNGEIIIRIPNGASIRELWCENIQLTSLDVSGYPTLPRLWATGNNIAVFNMEGCMNLKQLYLERQNVYVTIPPGESFKNPISYKDETGTMKATNIVGYGDYFPNDEVPIPGNISTVSFMSGATAFSSLSGGIHISRPGLTPIASMTTTKAGETINIKANWTNESSESLITANGVPLTNGSSTVVPVYDNGTVTVYSSYGARLVELECANNQLVSLNASNCTTLKKLDCSNNNLTELDITGCTNLENLYADGQAVEVKVLHNGTSFVNPISYKNKTGVEEVIIGAGNNSYAKGVGVPVDANATSTDFRSTNIGGTPFSGTINIKRTTTITFGTIAMSNTSGTTSRVSATWTGGTVMANGVVLPSSSIPIIDGKITLYTTDEAELTGLTIGMYGSDVKSIDLRNCTTLASVTCNYNAITKLNLEGCTALTNLNCSHNQIAELNLAGCISLVNFTTGNQAIAGTTMLLGENSFPSPIFYKNPAGVVEEIIIGDGNNSYTKDAEVPIGVNVTSVDFKTATNNFSGTIGITRPTLTPVISMTAKAGEMFNLNAKWENGDGILVNGTLLTNGSNAAILVPADGKITLYSAGGAELTELDCTNNRLTSLDASNCTTLRKLNCSNNNIAELNINGCTSLESLHANGQVVEFEVLSGETSFTNPIFYNNKTSVEDVTIGSGSDRYAKAAEVPVDASTTSLNFNSTNTISGSSFSGTINFTHTARIIFVTMTSTRRGGTVSISAKWESEGTIMANRTPLMKNGSSVSVPVSADGTIIIYTTDGAELKELKSDANQLTSLDASNCTTLELLDCNYNNITSLNISGCTNLTRLSASNQSIIVTVPTGETTFTNPILYHDISGIRNVMSAFGNQVPFNENSPSVNFSAFTTVHPLMHEFSGTITIRGATVTTLVTMKTNAPVGSRLDFSMMYTNGTVAVNGVSMGNNPTNTPVRSVTVPADGKIVLTTTETATRLTDLSCPDIQLSSLVVNNGAGLTALRCHDNELAYLDISNCPDLTTFNATGQTITLPVAGAYSGVLAIPNPISYNGSEVVSGIEGATVSSGDIVWTGLNGTSGSATYTFNAGSVNYSGTVIQPWEKDLYIWLGENSNWQDASNWAGSSIPNFENGKINTDIVETLALRGNSQEIPPLKGNTISTLILENTDKQLTINGNELNVETALNISAGSKGIKVEAGKILKANRIDNQAGVSALVVEAGKLNDSNNTNGALMVAPGSTPPVATVEFLSKAQESNARGELDTHSAWQYFGSPVAEFTIPAGTNAKIREYRGGKGIYWFTPEAGKLTATKGYEISGADSNPIQFTGTLINTDQEINFETQASWTSPLFWIASNPFTAAVDVRDITFGTNTVRTVYLFNTGSVNDWKTAGSDEQAPGQYTAFAPETNGGLIPSMQGFMLELETPGEGNITLPYNELKPNIAMRSTHSKEEQKCYTEVLLSSNDLLKDRVWLYTDVNATPGFDNGYDGRKIFGSNNLASLYSPGANADDYFQVSAVDNINQTYLAFKAEKGTTDYMLTFRHHNLSDKYKNLILVDLATGTETNVTTEGSVYFFSATNDYSTEKRFQLRAAEQTTQIGVADTMQDLLTVYQNEKGLIVKNNDDQHPSATITIYDIAGAVVDHFYLAAQSIRQLSTGRYSKGLYLFKLTLPDGVSETEKAIIK